jgi:hypothetical protein
MSSESPLAVYKGQTLEPLPTELNADGKSLKALPIPSSRSPAYDTHPAPICPPSEGNAFDFHGESRFYHSQCRLDLRPPLVYHNPDSAAEVQHARELHERIRREFPELRTYRFFEKPIGPHTLPMFEVNTFTPAETGALFGFLTVWRGPLS